MTAAIWLARHGARSSRGINLVDQPEFRPSSPDQHTRWMAEAPP
jgi:hypothetical protein